MILLKCCTQYASKFGKLIHGRRTGKVSFHSNPKERKSQRMFQLCLFHMLARLCSESFKLGFSSLWTKNFQMFKLDLEKAEEPGIKLPTFAGLGRKQRNSRKTSTSASLTMLKPLTEMGVPDHLTCLLRNQVKKEATVRTGHGMTDWFQVGKKYDKAVYGHPAYLTLMWRLQSMGPQSWAWLSN